MWTIVSYQPVSLISLKLSTATSTGGKSLLLPTPFAFKMALLDVILRTLGVEEGRQLWPVVRDARIALRGPQHIAVTNTFTKILRPIKGKPSPDPDTGLIRPLLNTIGFREYVQWQGSLQVAFQPGDAMAEGWPRWLSMITYLGKRGGFIQAEKVAQADELPSGFTLLKPLQDRFPTEGILQVMDDCAPHLTFEHVDIYSSKNIRVGKERLLHHVVIPYRLHKASRGFTLYQRLDA
ncbi:MAG TPA: hypothetical protein EYP25_09685 [Anaerolineae bacterium]|nr:hypothetical protein [Anaerolineae bacterium]